MSTEPGAGQADDRILRSYSDHEREIIALERDAVGLALEIAFNDRDQIAVDGAARRYDTFLSMLTIGKFTEDEIILHEKDRFPGLERLRGASPKVTEFEHNGSVLRVIHANRTRLEHTLGVDLIYISKYFDSLVGVQYKVMKGKAKETYFSPDANFHKQLAKMIKLWDQMKAASQPKRQIDYRLNNIPFYFKFVSRLETNFSDDSLCPGMYLPFDLVAQIRAANPPEKIGRRHGTRHLSNTEFANLIRQGWIGTGAAQTNLIEKLVDAAFSEKKSVMIGIQENAPV